MEQFLNINGLNIFIKTLGDGEPIVFLHGGPGSEHRFFLPHMEELSNQYHLVFYDQRGCGLSQEAGQYTIFDEVETLEQLRIALSLDTINLFGESWGTMLALLYAAKYPQNVNRVILTAAIGVTVEGFKVFEKELEKRVSEQDKASLKFLEDEIKNGKASVEDIFKILDSYYVYSVDSLLNKRNIKMNHTVNEKIGKNIRDNYDLSTQLLNLSNIPILVMQGDQDIISPAHLEPLLLDYIPHATLQNIKQCGHWTVVECPKTVKRLTKEFLTS